MWTIVDSITGKVLFAKFDNEVLENQIAIKQVCDIETDKEIYYDFETKNFYIK